MDTLLPVADRVLNSHLLYERARIAFRASGRFTEVRLPENEAAAHWTSPIPVRAKGLPNIYTLHDLIPLQFPYFVRDKDGAAAKLHTAIAAQADLIVTVSDASKRQIVDILKVPPERVAVTYQPCPALAPLPKEEAETLVRGVYGLMPNEYVLFLGAIEPKKNIKRLIEAMTVANTKLPLVLAGPLGWLYGEELRLIKIINQNTAANWMVSG